MYGNFHSIQFPWRIRHACKCVCRIFFVIPGIKSTIGGAYIIARFVNMVNASLAFSANHTLTFVLDNAGLLVHPSDHEVFYIPCRLYAVVYIGNFFVTI